MAEYLHFVFKYSFGGWPSFVSLLSAEAGRSPSPTNWEFRQFDIETTKEEKHTEENRLCVPLPG